ncbi:tRNA preQ1(34) S-adenosylmethionine ribosyltransferase-isomerase QueA [Hyphococcus flavus]|uniref:S-adenosylmethionine:tRNA ribosyltransferase-isomerase n=1 Tax=Hyphococcus flavus TaxID=1866326 RepID=A0AAE9ZAN0_9PROT|nr:tRNA preQ1(34) S-adenosylmethionine ribosyltransferase-isomerase QueA [Hyphococcus flavus]WDI30256.1 tRNA preQ1(34) S-adenosylmethionine ribosyltransferase-isomerase QueA [Hyphococcus flavus]
MRVDLFDFELPPERIALTPASPRDSARLLHVRQNGLDDRVVRELPSILKRGDLLVTNDTKVIPAQLFGKRAARCGGKPVSIEATLHKDLGGGSWRAFVRPAKRLKDEDVIIFSDALSATVKKRDGAEAELAFNVAPEKFQTALEQAGVMPLPPYIARKRPANETDRKNYQTMFADEAGSVAAPTAGLHFTPQLLDHLEANDIQHVSITLHVGAGTFLPVSVEDTTNHKMHAEWGEITQEQSELINTTRAKGGRIIAVGTTSLRLMESAVDENGIVRPFANETDIFITPGYRIKSADMLMTNFHLPRSTLFMLVCAFAGTETMKSAYAHAIDQQYRFYSYGDACLLELNHD